MSFARTPLVCGNWKMHKTVEETVALLDEILAGAGSLTGVEIAVAPSFVSLHAASKRLSSSKVRLAAQNVHFESQGAYTGEVSPLMLRAVSCRYAIIGHSERRQLFGETDEGCGRKVGAVLKNGMFPILCVGETLSEREANRTLEVVTRQMRAGLSEVAGEQAPEVVVAYEPVWAIGTGKTATPREAQEVHAHLRSTLRELFGEPAAERVRIQYGGSMKPDNARDLMLQPDIDGGLIGGASLTAEPFLAICKAAAA